MKKISRTFILLLFAFSFTKCKTVKQILNSHPVSSEDERKLALKTNDKNLLQLKNCEFAVNISKSDFDTLVIPKLSELINNKKIGHVVKYNISGLKSEMKDEQIAISANIQITFDTLNASIEGDLIGTIMFVFRNDSIILFPAFKFIHVDDLTYMKVGLLKRKAIAYYLNQQLKATIENINGYMISQISSIPLNLIDREIASQELVKDSGLKVTLSKPLKISTPIVVSSCLVNENGIQIIGAFDSLNNISQTLNDGEFKAFQDNFRTKRSSFFLDLPSEKTTYMAIGKSALSQIFNAALKDEEIDIKFATDNFLSGKIDKNIKIDLSEIDCWKVNPPCINCGPCPTCDGFWSCLTFLPRLALWGTCKALCGAEVVTVRSACELFKQGLEIVLTDKISIGDIHLNVSSAADVQGSIERLQFNKDLSGFSTSFSAKGSAPLKTTIGFTPEGPVGHLVCLLRFERPYEFFAVLPKISITDSIVSSFEKDSTNGGLFLKIGTPSSKFTIDIFPTPLQTLTADFPVLIDCSLGLTLANIYKGFRDIFNVGDFENNILKIVFNGKYDYTLDKRELKLPIKPVKIKIFSNSGQVLLKPIAKKTYIGFYRDVMKPSKMLQ